MSIDKNADTRLKILVVVVPLLIILFPFGYSVVSLVFAQGAPSDEPFLEKPDARYTSCVKDTEYMRYHHWVLLNEIRDEVVREPVLRPARTSVRGTRGPVHPRGP